MKPMIMKRTIFIITLFLMLYGCRNSYELLKRSDFPMGIIVKPKSINIKFNEIYSSFNEIIKKQQNKNMGSGNILNGQ